MLKTEQLQHNAEFPEMAVSALLRNRLNKKSPATITELAREIKLSRAACSMAINRNAFPRIQRKISEHLKLPFSYEERGAS